MSKEITFETETLTVDKPGKYSSDFRVTADINPPEVLNQFDAWEILEHKDKDKFLDEIGEEYARQYFCIETNEETDENKDSPAAKKVVEDDLCPF